jgi:hypothetical protein
VGEFFRGWRRKVGCVTLLMTLGFMAGWVRSLITMDELTVPGIRATHYLNSTDGTLGWWMRINDPNLGPSFQTRRSNSSEWASVLEQIDIHWTFKWCGFGCGESHRNQLQIWMMPYWSIVMPVTALSAYLLFVNSRKSTQTKLPEPTVKEGA